MSRQRKSAAVLRLLRGEDLETVSRELGVTAATLGGLCAKAEPMQYHKFSAGAKVEVRNSPASKPPEVPKAEPVPEDTLGTLAALGRAVPEIADSRSLDPDPEERAAIVEDAGMPRAWAEGYAALADQIALLPARRVDAADLRCAPPARHDQQR
jgi:hypothetical protein